MPVFISPGKHRPFCIFVLFVASNSVVSDYMPSGINGMDFEYVIRYQVHKNKHKWRNTVHVRTTNVQDPEARLRRYGNQVDLKTKQESREQTCCFNLSCSLRLLFTFCCNRTISLYQ